MKNKKLLVKISLIVFAVLLLLSYILLSLCLSRINESLETLESKTKSFEKTLTEFQIHQDLQIEKIIGETTSLLENQEKNKNEIQKSLSLMDRKSDVQFSKTVTMSKTYDELLAEQKKKTVDTAEKDMAILEAKKEAVGAYEKGQYAFSYEEFRRLLEANGEDMECRLYKAKSLYYMNRADSTKYQEILDEIKILIQNSAADDETAEIERSILAEKGGIDE